MFVAASNDDDDEVDSNDSWRDMLSDSEDGVIDESEEKKASAVVRFSYHMSYYI